MPSTALFYKSLVKKKEGGVGCFFFIEKSYFFIEKSEKSQRKVREKSEKSQRKVIIMS